MAHREAKQKAFELFSKGLHPPDASGMLNINLRTCQRWYQEFLKEKNNGAASSSDKTITVAPEKAEKEEEKNPIANKNPTPWIAEPWLEAAENLSEEHYRVHRVIRNKILKNLIQKLEEPDVNLRAVHTLSLAVARHTEAERIAVSLDILDINRACKVVESHGLIISLPSEREHDEE